MVDLADVLAREVIDEIEDTEPPSIGELIGHEIRPCPESSATSTSHSSSGRGHNGARNVLWRVIVG